MFDRAFFETSFNRHVDEKRKWAPDGSVRVRFHLSSGEIVTVWSLEEATDGSLVLGIYPRRGKARKTPKAERDLGAPQYDLDRLAIPYEAIIDVEITTLAQKDRKAGFQQAMAEE